MKCFFHSIDLDGHCSGAIVKLGQPECAMIGINHGDQFPWERIVTGETVYMVDFALQPFDEMIKLAQRCRLVWIDHHASALQEAEQALQYGLLAKPLDGLRDDKLAGCELTWIYFSALAGERGRLNQEAGPEDRNHVVELLGRYDVWDHAAHPSIIPFQYGMRGIDTWPDKGRGLNLWKRLLVYQDQEMVDHIVEMGRAIHAYQEQIDEQDAQALGFDAELDGLRCRAFNRRRANGRPFREDAEGYDAVLAFWYENGRWTVSLYSDGKVDVGAIAKARGGGGHKGAAGFQCQELPFTEAPLF